MRDIKFRVWHKIEKKWLDDNKVAITSDGVVHALCFCELDETLNDQVNVMRYTGLLDKNSNEIYEGDIVFTPDALHYKDDWIVEWNDEICGWGLKSPQNKTYWESCGDFQDSFEVIGNIYENPELLEAA